MRAGGDGWGGAGAGGSSWGGGSYHFQNNNWQRGYQGYHPMYGDGARNSWWGGNRINVNNNFYNRDYNGWNNNWRNGGYWRNRPWNVGWYGGWGGWGWWGASSVGWGLAGLATGAAITGLVDGAANNSSPVIVVPNTSYELNYGSVEAVGSFGASFTTTSMAASCLVPSTVSRVCSIASSLALPTKPNCLMRSARWPTAPAAESLLPRPRKCGADSHPLRKPRRRAIGSPSRSWPAPDWAGCAGAGAVSGWRAPPVDRGA